MEMVMIRRKALRRELIPFIALICARCDVFTFYDLMSPNSSTAGGELSISPLSVTLSVKTQCAFTVTGGKPPYAFSIVSGQGTIDPDNGVYTAPAEPGSDVIQVVDREGSIKQALVTCVE